VEIASNVARTPPAPSASLGMTAGVLFTHHCHYNTPPMRVAAMFEKENALPCPELQFPLHDWDDFARPGECHPNV